MARLITADFQYSQWYDEWDWAEYQGRSVTRWGSSNNFNGQHTHKPSDLRMPYDPGQNTTCCANHYQMRRFRAAMGYRAIVLQALWYFRHGTSASSGLVDFRMHNYLKSAGYPEIDDMDMIYKDESDVIKWFSDAYAAQYGQDISTAYIAQAWFDRSIANNGFFAPFDITDYFTEQLLTNEDLWLEFFQVTGTPAVFVGTSNLPERPKMEVAYFFPLEMFPEATGGGEPDYARLLNTDNQPIDLGALQAGETGTAKKLYLVNFSGDVIEHAEVWDDYPQWSEPAADAGNSGTADLDYITVFEDCTSQRWEVKFLTPTTYEVKATAYLNELESLHPQYDADGDWQGAVGGDWSDPGGNITIPSAAWSGTAVADDLITFRTRGNTTDNTWPADSNDQVEFTIDDAGSPGSPDNSKWRPITGQRTQATAGITIDMATKTVTVQRIDTTKWPIGTEVFIADRDNIDRGNVKSVTATTVEIENLAITNNTYSAGAVVATTLEVRDLAAAVWAQLSAASGASQPNKDRLYIDNAASHGFTGTTYVFVQSLLDPEGTYEEAYVDSVQTDYLDLDQDLTNDYAAGALVLAKDSGVLLFHIRPNTDPGTDEELKEFRLNVLVL
jgi:hypothetical protein